MQAHLYPTLNLALPHLERVSNKITQQMKDIRARSTFLNATKACLAKLETYKQYWEQQDAPWIAMLLDPRMKLDALKAGGQFNCSKKESRMRQKEGLTRSGKNTSTARVATPFSVANTSVTHLPRYV